MCLYPYEKVEHPKNKLPLSEDKEYFHGDNRGPFEEGTSRMKQTFVVETDPNKSESPLLQQSDHQATTILYDNKGNVLKSKQASSEYSADVTRTDENGGDNVQIDVSGHGKNPLLDYPGIPAIDYEYQININPGTGDQNSPVIQVSGDHDRFPAHTIQVTDMENGNVFRMHEFTPESKGGIKNLYPPFLNEKVEKKNKQ